MVALNLSCLIAQPGAHQHICVCAELLRVVLDASGAVRMDCAESGLADTLREVWLVKGSSALSLWHRHDASSSPPSQCSCEHELKKGTVNTSISLQQHNDSQKPACWSSYWSQHICFETQTLVELCCMLWFICWSYVWLLQSNPGGNVLWLAACAFQCQE